jgi:hypothetical protein
MHNREVTRFLELPALWSGFCERCLAVSERPIVPTSPDEAEENVLPPGSETLVEIVDNALVESALLFGRAAFSQRQLDEDQVLTSADAKEVWIVDEVGLVMFRDHLEAVVLGCF